MLVDKEAILNQIAQIEPQRLITCIEESFIAYSTGQAVVPPVGTLMFDSPPGETHIKYGYLKGERTYVIKIASGFYENPAKGLPSTNGLNLVFSQETGELQCVLLDEGYLTDRRTALAGAVIAKHFAPTTVSRIGIVGTGVQARMQLNELKHVCDCRSVIVWGRCAKKAEAYAVEMREEGFEIETTLDAKDIVDHCNLIVTTTPTKSPILDQGILQRGSLVTAMGADTPGKRELSTAILKQADLILMDSQSQCEHHGEIHIPFAAGELDQSNMKEIGDLLEQKSGRVNDQQVIIADLTGIATQDILISQLVLNQMDD